MVVEAITREPKLWRVVYKREDDHTVYSYYAIDRFRDELDVFNWINKQWEQANEHGNISV